jgi:putative ABC transport system permease protein
MSAASVWARLSGIFEGVFIALDAIRSNKVRAGLTILGIAVGVFAVVTMAAAIHGINDSVAKDIESAGATTFFVFRGPIGFNVCDDNETCEWIHNPPITMAEASALSKLPSVTAVVPELDFAGSFKYHDRVLPGAQILSYTADWTMADGGEIDPGRSFTERENSSGDKVVLINDLMRDRLMGQEVDPVGKTITINNMPFTIIGFYHYHPSFISGGERAVAIMPIETLLRNFEVSPWYINLTVKPRITVPRDEAIDDVTSYLRVTRQLKPETKSNFHIVTQDRLFQVYNSVFSIIFGVMLGLSAVGLLVGGVGVIGIMMISVTERTREIGVRKALGATRLVIMWQFLIEAVTLTSIGVAIGFAAGWGVAALIKALFPIPASIPPIAIVGAVCASIVTGIVFGIIPAFRAARLDPVTALRYE